MKKNLIILAVVIATFFVACDKNSPNPMNDSELKAGKSTITLSVDGGDSDFWVVYGQNDLTTSHRVINNDPWEYEWKNFEKGNEVWITYSMSDGVPATVYVYDKHGNLLGQSSMMGTSLKVLIGNP